MKGVLTTIDMLQHIPFPLRVIVPEMTVPPPCAGAVGTSPGRPEHHMVLPLHAGSSPALGSNKAWLENVTSFAR